MTTIKTAYAKLVEALTNIYDEREANNISSIIFEDVFNVNNPNRETPFDQHDKLNDIITRMLNHEPMQYVIGEADFWGMKFKVNEHVHIPRGETEELVDWVKDVVNESGQIKNMIDIGTGSGNIPLALKKEFPNIQVAAVDVTEEAVAVARQNASMNNLEVDLQVLDILDESQWSKIPQQDIVISNPPYIPVKEKELMPEHVLGFEPPVSLFVPNEDPLQFYKKIVKFAKQKLTPNGFLFFETNEFNANDVVQLLKDNGFRDCELRQDMSGRDRRVVGRV